NIFGWYKADGTRRYREIYIEVGRKNGKTTLMAGIGLYMLFADGEPGAEVYSAAYKKDQARIVFEEAANMRKKAPLLAQRIQVMGSKRPNNLNVVETASKFEPLCSEDKGLDGLNIHCALIDELHAHPTRALYDVLFEASASRRSPLNIAITTAGSDRLTICYYQHEHAEKILVGAIAADKGDEFFAYIACADEGDDWKDEQVWYKANPGLMYGVVKIDKLRAAANKAAEEPTALNSFLRKHLNVWTSQDVRWMLPDKWAACCVGGHLADTKKARTAALEMLKGRLAYGGLDMSSKIDLTAFALVFPPIPDVVRKTLIPSPVGTPHQYKVEIVKEGDPKWYVLVWQWMPKDNAPDRIKKDRIPYDVWEREGFIWFTQGNVVDQDFVRAKVNEICKMFKVQEIAFDSWNCTQMSINLQQDGRTMKEARQGFKTMSEPMKEVMAMVLGKKIEHFGDPVLTWNMGNVQATQDPAGNIKPDKERSKEKIDGAVATIMAMSRVVANPGVGKPSVYKNRGIVFI